MTGPTKRTEDRCGAGPFQIVAGAAALSALILLGAPVATMAQPEPSGPRVVGVLTATADVHDAAQMDGRVLVATSGGLLVRRGDTTEQVLTSRDGLPGTRMRSVSVTPEGAWVGGVEGTALVDCEGARCRVTRTLDLGRARRAVHFAGATWLGTYGGGLFRFTDEDPEPRRVDLGRQPARGRITDMVAHDGQLWVGTAGSGILKLDAEGSLLGRIRGGLADPMVSDLLVDGDRVLVATVSGVSVVGPDGIERRAHVARASRRLPIMDVRSIHRGVDHTYVATWGAGLYRIDDNRSRPTRIRSRASDIRARVVIGTEQGVWIGHDRGLGLLEPGRARVSDVRTGGLPSADVTALAYAFGSLFVGTFRHGLAVVRNGRAQPLDRAMGRWGLDGRINDLAVTGSAGAQRLWIATDRGLFWHDGRRFSPVVEASGPGRSHVTSLHVDGEGALWVTSSRQLSRYRQARWRSWSGDERFPVMNLHAVTTDSRGRVWVGSLHGLYRFEPDVGTFERHTVSSGALPVDWVTALLPWGDGVVAGTYHGGLSWHDGSTFRIEREGSSGIPAGWVNPHAMRWIGGTLYVGTLERGLVVGRSGSWAHLSTEDGLPSADVTDMVAADDGHVWVATRGGLARLRTR